MGIACDPQTRRKRMKRSQAAYSRISGQAVRADWRREGRLPRRCRRRPAGGHCRMKATAPATQFQEPSDRRKRRPQGKIRRIAARDRANRRHARQREAGLKRTTAQTAPAAACRGGRRLQAFSPERPGKTPMRNDKKYKPYVTVLQGGREAARNHSPGRYIASPVSSAIASSAALTRRKPNSFAQSSGPNG